MALVRASFITNFHTEVWACLHLSLNFFAQLCISDGVEAIGAIAKRNLNRSTMLRSHVPEENPYLLKLSSRTSTYTSVTREVDSEVLHVEEVLSVPFHANEFHGPSHGSGSKDEKLHILIIDADSEDPR